LDKLYGWELAVHNDFLSGAGLWPLDTPMLPASYPIISDIQKRVESEYE
jgi:hypothetical protein